MAQYLRLLKFLLPYKYSLYASVFLTLLFAVSNVMVMPLIRDIANEVADKNLVYFTNHIFSALILFTLRLTFKYAQYYLMAWVGHRVILDIRMALYEKLQDFSLDFYSKWKTGDVLTRFFSDVDRVKDALIQGFEQILPQSVTLIAVIGYLFYLNWRLTLISIVGVPLFIFLTMYFAEKLKKTSVKVQRKTADLAHIVQETIANIAVIKAYTFEKREIARFHKESNRNFMATMKGVRYTVIQEPFIGFLQFLVILLVIWYGGYQVTKDIITGPMLLAFFTGILLLVDPVMALSRVYTMIKQATASTERIFSLLDLPATIQNHATVQKVPSLHGNVTFENVSFAYEANQSPVLKNINLDVKKGEIIALVGLSGAGKSTMVNLIPRFYDPTEGSIKVDGIDLRDIQLNSLRSQLAIVPQESILFRGTLLDNIRYGKLNATEEEVIEAAKKANAWEFIEKMPGKLRSRLGDRGYKLSGGQKQRVSIARAILRDPKILILDEATSALDSKSEALVQEALITLMEGRTTFVIAHRLSTIVHAHKIVVLENGRIVEIGTHDELVGKGGAYYHFYRIQFEKKKK